MARHFELSPMGERPDDLCLLSEEEPDGRPALRPQYRPFQCRKCGRVDEVACFRQGLPDDFRGPVALDASYTVGEWVHVWSRRLADVVLPLAADHLDVFELPGDPKYVVPWPRRMFEPPPDTRVCTPIEPGAPGEPFQFRSRPCRKCGRRWSTFVSESFVVPDDVVLAAVGIYFADGVARSLTWIVNEEIAQRVSAAELNNVKVANAFSARAP